jgi:hypothetical protein
VAEPVVRVLRFHTQPVPIQHTPPSTCGPWWDTFEIDGRLWERNAPALHLQWLATYRGRQYGNYVLIDGQVDWEVLGNAIDVLCEHAGLSFDAVRRE